MKTNKILALALAAGAAALTGIGCSSSSTCGDGGTCTDAIQTDTAPAETETLFGLTRGASCYIVLGVAPGAVDGCGIGLSATVGQSLPSNYVDTTATFSLGNMVGSPVMYSLGTGVVSHNMATLARDNLAGNSTATCTWHQTDMGVLTLTAADAFTLTVTETEDGYATTCLPTDLPPTDPCTSTWTWTLTKGTSCP